MSTGAASAGKSESSPASASAATYKLEGKTSDVRPHLNHQVEITGRLESHGGSPSTAASPTRSGNTSTRSGDDSRSSSGEQELHVESVRMISATCSR